MTTFDQSQNEALIRLMILAKYQDRHLSLLEDQSFTDRIEALRWSSPTARELFVNAAIAEVREAISTADGASRLLARQCARFDSPESRRQALEHLEALIQSDGLGDGEDALLAALREHLAR